MTEQTMRELVMQGLATWVDEENLTISLMNPDPESTSPIIVKILKKSKEESN